jgi:uncharacterized protein YoxC
MNYVILIFLLLTFALTVILAVYIHLMKKAKGEIKELKTSLDSARTELRRLGEYTKKKEEIQKDVDKKKENLRTGNDSTDFDNSLKLFHDAHRN